MKTKDFEKAFDELKRAEEIALNELSEMQTDVEMLFTHFNSLEVTKRFFEKNYSYEEDAETLVQIGRAHV